jgi:CheY-like chemotaxis protein
MLTENPNALIVDIEMPGLSGAELIQLVRSWPQCRLIPILALVASNARDAITRALLAGANDVLLKPVQESLLIDHVTSRFWHQGPTAKVSHGTDVIPRMVTACLYPPKPPKPTGSTTTLVAAAKALTNLVGAVNPWARMGKRRS